MPLKHPKDRDKDRDRNKVKERDRERHSKPSHAHKQSSSTPERTVSSPISSTTRLRKHGKDPSMERRRSVTTTSPSSSKTSLPYPSFSKAHSKEAVGREVPGGNPDTPNPTDLGRVPLSDPRADGTPDGKAATVGQTGSRGATAPPSPPLTAVSQPTQEDAVWSERKVEDDRDSEQASKERDTKHAEGQGADPRKLSTSDARTDTGSADAETESCVDSDATSLARNHPLPSFPGSPNPTRLKSQGWKSSTPAGNSDVVPSPDQSTGSTTMSDVEPDGSRAFDRQQSRLASPAPAPPPPPPPPPSMPVAVPRVDYLLRNGGLPHDLPRTLLAAPRATLPSVPFSLADVHPVAAGSSAPSPVDISHPFAAYSELLDGYYTVLSKNGSLAVATGYRSVARKLLDRLESVFARDISSENCDCIICRSQGPSVREDHGTIGWGEMLEWVSGRRELPPWPPFDFACLGEADTGNVKEQSRNKPSSDITGGGDKWTSSPPLDVDVTEEFREHYVRQSKKTKQSVDRWLASQPITPVPPPQEVDDETLTFVMLTHLHPRERSLFTQLLAAPLPMTGLAESRSPTPSTARPNSIAKTNKALQRLYRLSSCPRDPESAVFLLRYPTLHNILASIAAVTLSEWDLLTSGRFDGFLWSGAENPSSPLSPHVSRGPTPLNLNSNGSSPPSRNPTPFLSGGFSHRSPTPFHTFAAAASRGATPAPSHPIAHDEDMEVAILAEVEREIYLGMEALEDAFEALHRKAETVRRALRERSAGLSVAGQRRHAFASGSGGGIEIYAGTPGPPYAAGLARDHVDSEDDGPWDGADGDATSELWPDDSASNVSSSRRRRPKRRNERRTPALVEEESDTEVDL